MAGREPLSLPVEVFMIGKEALWAEWDHGATLNKGVALKELFH